MNPTLKLQALGFPAEGLNTIGKILWLSQEILRVCPSPQHRDIHRPILILHFKHVFLYTEDIMLELFRKSPTSECIKYKHRDKKYDNVLYRPLIIRKWTKKYSSSLLYKLTICFSSSRLHRSCLLNVKSPHPKRYICLSEDKATLILPVELEMKLKGCSGGICPIGLECRSHKALLLPGRIDYFSNVKDRIDINYLFPLSQESVIFIRWYFSMS